MPVPLGFQDENRDLRVLHCSDYDFEETYSKMVSHDRKIRDYITPLLLDHQVLLPYFEEGFYYGYGRDRGMRPMHWLSVRKLIDSPMWKKPDGLDQLLKLIDLLSNYTLENALLPGKFETWRITVDLD